MSCILFALLLYSVYFVHLYKITAMDINVYAVCYVRPFCSPFFNTIAVTHIRSHQSGVFYSPFSSPLRFVSRIFFRFLEKTSSSPYFFPRRLAYTWVSIAPTHATTAITGDHSK